jgi:putative acetyltransferase
MDKSFIIRTATNRDRDKIIDLVKRTLPEFDYVYAPDTYESDLANIEANYTHKGGTFEVIETFDSDIIGTVALQKADNNTCWLKKMYIDSNYRGLKLGDLLLKKALQKAVKLHFKEVCLQTAQSMSAAINLFKKYGFVIKEDGDDITMSKKLL